MLMTKLESPEDREIDDIQRLITSAAGASALSGAADPRITKPAAERLRALKGKFKGGRARLAAEASTLADQMSQGGPVDHTHFMALQNMLGRLRSANQA